MKEKCVLYDRDCIDCGECEFCDLDPTKICDNCGKCLEGVNMDYATIKIDSVETSRSSNASDDCDCDCDCDADSDHHHHHHRHNN